MYGGVVSTVLSHNPNSSSNLDFEKQKKLLSAESAFHQFVMITDNPQLQLIIISVAALFSYWTVVQS